MKALEIYKPPFHVYGIYIYSSNTVMTFNILTRDKQLINGICDVLNKEDAHMNLEGITHDGIYILKDGKKILVIRGWGHLTGCGGLNLPAEEAARIQDEFRDWVIRKISGDKPEENSED